MAKKILFTVHPGDTDIWELEANFPKSKYPAKIVVIGEYLNKAKALRIAKALNGLPDAESLAELMPLRGDIERLFEDRTISPITRITNPMKLF